MFTPAGGRKILFVYEILLWWKTERDTNRVLPKLKVSIEYQAKRTLLFCDIMERKVAGPPSGKSETYSPPPGPRGPGHTIGHKVGAGCGCVHAPGRDHPPSPPPTTPWNQGHILPPMGPTTTGNSSMYKIIWNTSRLTKFVNTQSLKNCSLFRSFTGL